MMYCIRCFYNLAGLVEHRCPECGKHFDPNISASYSRTPSPERLKKLIQQAKTGWADAVSSLMPGDPVSERISALQRKVAALSADNEKLWDHVTWMLGLLLEKGVITEDDVRNQLEREQFGTLPEVAAAEEMGLAGTDGEEPPPLELLNLEQAARHLRGEGKQESPSL